MTEHSPALEESLSDLREETLTLITLFNGVMGILWFFWIGWPGAQHLSFTSAWIGTALLLISGIGSLLLKQKNMSLSANWLVWGFLAATVCAVFTFTSPGFIYLLILPILFASVLLSTSNLLLIAVVTSILTLGIGLVRYSTPFSAPPSRPMAFIFQLTVQALSGDIALPVVIILFVTLTAWFSTQNLHTALMGMWSGYERARRNEEEARKHQAELARVLKALDEATYRWKRANYMMTLARDQAEDARRLKQQFAQTISHELRTPLNLIVGFIEVMVESPEYYGGTLPPTYMRDLSIVYRNARHLQDMVNDVLDLARIEAAQMGLIPEETDIAALVQDVINTAHNLVEARGLALHVDIAPDLPHLWVDPTRIRQVLFNLLNNAARFTEQGSVTVQVHARDEDVLFAVSDTGAGIAPEDVERIFEEFQQADGSTRRPQEGVGLGLAISRRFVKLHKGHIWVESTPGAGSTFFFSLPKQQAQLDGTPESALNLDHEVLEKQNEAILLAVTCSPSAAILLNRYIRGYRTIVVRDLDHAKRAMQQVMPQAVVIDTAGEKICSDELNTLALTWGLHRIPFIACPFPGEEPLRQHLNVEGYLVKPITRQSLWDTLNRLEHEVQSVLIVDDDRDFVRLLKRMLDIPVRRFQISSAHSGQEAIAMIHLRPPDLVLLDLMLPDISGLEVLTHIRDIPGGEDIPIIIISAQDEVNSSTLIQGTVRITKAEGLMPGEEIQWIQKVLDTATQTHNESIKKWR